VRVHGVIGDVKGRNVIFFDDEIITGNSILEGAVAVLDKGAKSIYAGCVHGTLAEGTVSRLSDTGLKHLAITDTIPLPPKYRDDKIAICSVANLFAAAIRAIHDETSISALFK
jgi:ribose-phosphate pyrophosphokinase